MRWGIPVLRLSSSVAACDTISHQMARQTTVVIRRSEGSVSSSDGTLLYEQSWIPMGAKAAVLLVHGYAEHSSRYKHVAHFLAERGYAVHTYDQRGHGRTGTGLVIDHWGQFLDDLDVMLSRVRERWPEKPVFLYGHSMGGAVVASYLISRQADVDGAILSSALLKIPDTVSPMLIRLSALVSKIAPRLKTIKLDTALLSQDPEVVAAYNADPLNYHGGLPARIGAEMNRTVEVIQANMEAVQVPLLIWHGDSDRITDPEGSRQLYARAGAADKTLHIYEGGFHEMHNEPNQEDVFNDLVNWLDACVDDGAAHPFAIDEPDDATEPGESDTPSKSDAPPESHADESH